MFRLKPAPCLFQSVLQARTSSLVSRRIFELFISVFVKASVSPATV